jgi:hypothetical protein
VESIDSSWKNSELLFSYVPNTRALSFTQSIPGSLRQSVPGSFAMRQSDRKIESKVASLFTGLRACFACARHKPSNEQIPSHKYAEGVRCSRLRV